jgi:lipopolysaccharide transport system ATP-binding protein
MIPAISVRNIGKRYRIGAKERAGRTLRETIVDLAAAPFRRLGRIGRPTAPEELIWALKDVSFDVQPGEVVGVIGRNGAGKSTLLKIMSRITEPTEGRIELRGRVASLLEVGTGFHPELTGRENIYLNGTILGMKKAEIDKKFDVIVAFSEIEKFLDTPVKHYSSGMYVRLAFAVAAHLEPEILLVDEVLAVGDAAFQKKCLGKMEDVAKAGRTVLFVSHQMNSIRKLCGRCIWLDGGRLRLADTMVKVVCAYETESTSESDAAWRTGDDHVAARFMNWEVLDPKAEPAHLMTTLGPVTFKFALRVNQPVLNGVHGIALWSSNNQLIWTWATYQLNLNIGVWECVYTLPGLPLRPGAYSWHVSLYSEGRLLDEWHCVPQLMIATEPLTHPLDEWSGILNMPCQVHFRGAQDSS